MAVAAAAQTSLPPAVAGVARLSSRPWVAVPGTAHHTPVGGYCNRVFTKAAAVAITGIRATPVSPGCETETGTKGTESASRGRGRHMPAFPADGAWRNPCRREPCARRQRPSHCERHRDAAALRDDARGPGVRHPWGLACLADPPRVNRDPLPPRYLIIVRYHGDDTLGQASAARHIPVKASASDAIQFIPMCCTTSSASNQDRLPHGLTRRACAVGGCREQRRFGLRPTLLEIDLSGCLDGMLLASAFGPRLSGLGGVVRVPSSCKVRPEPTDQRSSCLSNAQDSSSILRRDTTPGPLKQTDFVGGLERAQEPWPAFRIRVTHPPSASDVGGYRGVGLTGNPER